MFSIITPFFSLMVLQKSYDDLLLKKHFIINVSRIKVLVS